jgi:hypothetical protein
MNQMYYHVYSDRFPSALMEDQGWRAGVATHIGDVLTYKVFTNQNKVIYQSAICSTFGPC